MAKITRVESWVNLGIPDCIVALYGKFHLVELKVASDTGKVKLSPHQVAFHAAHRDCPTWVFVQYGKGKKAKLMVYEGGEVHALAEFGVAMVPEMVQDYPWDWQEIEDYLTKFKN
jgi:hypothetical protein